jgi:hypothetical protein
MAQKAKRYGSRATSSGQPGSGLIQIKEPRQRNASLVLTATGRDAAVLTRPNESEAFSREASHSNRHEKAIGLLFVIGSAGALLALLAVLSYFA